MIHAIQVRRSQSGILEMNNRDWYTQKSITAAAGAHYRSLQRGRHLRKASMQSETYLTGVHPSQNSNTNLSFQIFMADL